MEDRLKSALKEEILSFMEVIVLSVVDCRSYRRDLTDLDAFLAMDSPDIKGFTSDQILRLLEGFDIASTTRRAKLGRIRRFSEFLKTLGIKTTLPELPRTPSVFEPYIFTIEEMGQIFEAADDLLAIMPRSAVAAELPMLLRILYGCGLRTGEALALTWDDVDLEGGTLTIRKAKENKQRIVPMAEELTSILGYYRAAPCFAMEEHGFLFKKKDGTPRPQSSYDNAFNAILFSLGIKGGHTQSLTRGPCFHSIRHVFVLHSLLKADAEGRSFMETVPFLSTYLGHEGLMETDKYLKARYDLYRMAHKTIEQYTVDVFPEVSQPW